MFENFRSKCLELYELIAPHFLWAPGLTWLACLKKTKVELELLTDIDMLLIVEKRIRSRMHYDIHRNAKTHGNTWKIMILTKIPQIVNLSNMPNIGRQANCMTGQCYKQNNF